MPILWENQLDDETRAKMHNQDTMIWIMVCLVVFVFGMIFGNVIHDISVHPLGW